MNKTIVAAFALSALLTASIALAQTPTSTPPKLLPVIFPIAELGGCADKLACRAYCDIQANRDACYAYAQTHGLMRKDEVDRAREFLKQRIGSSTKEREGTSTPKIIPGFPVRGNASSSIDAILAAGGGPGGCTTREACKAYCADTTHSAECLQFAKDHQLMTGPEIEKAKKLKSLVGPGGCRGEQCKEYCEDSAHEDVCITFAQQNGFISKDDAEHRLEKMRFSSTTRPFNIPVNATGTVGTTTGGFRPNLDTARLKGLCNTAEECKQYCIKNPVVCAPGKPDGNNGTTTKPYKNPFGTSTKSGDDRPKPPPPPPTSNSGANIDYSKPPYHCTPAQASEGACDDDQFPGYTPPTGSDQGGSIFLSIWRYFFGN